MCVCALFGDPLHTYATFAIKSSKAETDLSDNVLFICAPCALAWYAPSACGAVVLSFE